MNQRQTDKVATMARKREERKQVQVKSKKTPRSRKSQDVSPTCRWKSGNCVRGRCMLGPRLCIPTPQQEKT
jgi:hypothetical protein